MGSDQKTCFACGGELVLFGPRLAYQYDLCTSCGSLQLSPMPDERTLEEAYAEEYASADQVEEFGDPARYRKVSLPYHQALVDSLAEHGASDLIVEIGSGWGHLAEMVVERGLPYEGTELSVEMAQHCREEGLPVHQGGFDLIETRSPDVGAVVMCAVFEHLVDHHRWLRRINRILPVDGLFVSLHPTAKCYTLLGDLVRLGNREKELPELHGSFAPPWHTALVSLEAMEIMAARSGFEVVDVRPAPQGRIGGWLGAAQFSLEQVNRIGGFLMGVRWPLITTHVFVLRKTNDLEATD